MSQEYIKNMSLKSIGVFILISNTLSSAFNSTSSGDSPVSMGTLSRRKRYITFPPGSILQLGYCLAVPSLIPDGIWLYGITFGTNWEIPTDPIGLKFPREAEVVHRRHRRDLYQKLLPLLNTMGLDGQSCLLRVLCESGQRQSGPKGSFLEEILHAIFTLPRTKTNYLEDDDDEDDFAKYEAAHRSKGDCTALFPSCLKDPDAS
ncbi:uncharacterized protein LOC110837198 [Zootermopsis nevadensis]|uniref:uncharacterized protein LOC110837198 n=1 Tax=Zootermopsis nevadensis TaxID=136037 RepID=UPI000B8ED70E|nr:uncharacterized protein LOC110837198 [Zootermopsis nevadensis]